jgi:hypothetical protein
MICLLSVTLEGLRPCVMKVMMLWKVSIIYKNRQFLFFGCPIYIRIRNLVEGHEEVEGSDYLGSDNENRGGSIKSTGGREYVLAYHQWIAYFEWLQLCSEKAARYRQFEVCAFVDFLYCLVLIIG